jgi:hypothetical protein
MRKKKDKASKRAHFQSHLICNWLPLSSFHHQFLESLTSSPLFSFSLGLPTPTARPAPDPQIDDQQRHRFRDQLRIFRQQLGRNDSAS